MPLTNMKPTNDMGVEISGPGFGDRVEQQQVTSSTHTR